MKLNEQALNYAFMKIKELTAGFEYDEQERRVTIEEAFGQVSSHSEFINLKLLKNILRFGIKHYLKSEEFIRIAKEVHDELYGSEDR